MTLPILWFITAALFALLGMRVIPAVMVVGAVVYVAMGRKA